MKYGARMYGPRDSKARPAIATQQMWRRTQPLLSEKIPPYGAIWMNRPPHQKISPLPSLRPRRLRVSTAVATQSALTRPTQPITSRCLVILAAPARAMLATMPPTAKPAVHNSVESASIASAAPISLPRSSSAAVAVTPTKADAA
eukprot:scaffold58991_cov27-Tisochrysis_lutea.AAC.4